MNLSFDTDVLTPVSLTGLMFSTLVDFFHISSSAATQYDAWLLRGQVILTHCHLIPAKVSSEADFIGGGVLALVTLTIIMSARVCWEPTIVLSM